MLTILITDSHGFHSQRKNHRSYQQRMRYGIGFQKFLKFRRSDAVNSDKTFGPGHETGYELLEHAAELKKEGDYSAAMGVLILIADQGRGDSAVVAGYELALLQSQLGIHKKADRRLKKLGFSFKLTNAILNPTPYRECQDARARASYPYPFAPPPTRNCDPVATFNHALPTTLLQSLQTAFSSSSVFWTEHKYPTNAFFSYNIKQSSNQSSVMTQLVDHLIPIVASHFPNFKAPSIGSSVEWWCHMRDETSGYAHQLHFDLDEAALHDYNSCNQNRKKRSILQRSEKEKQMQCKLHPMVSAVLFLSDQDNGAPTLVTDQTLDAESIATQAWLCHPALNRLLLFDGKLLHGVVPHLKNQTEEPRMHTDPRITLMIGFWDKEFESKGTFEHVGSSTMDNSRKSIPQHLGPNMPMPSVSSTSNNLKNGDLSSITIKSHCSAKKDMPIDATWPLLFAPLQGLEKDVSGRRVLCNTSSNTAGLVHIPGPIWMPLRPELEKDKNDKDEEIDKDEDDEDEEKDVQINAKYSNYSDAVEFISIDELNKLRNLATTKEEKSEGVVGKIGNNNEVGNNRLSKRRRNSAEENDIIFTGKWFLKNIAEIRDDVLHGAKK